MKRLILFSTALLLSGCRNFTPEQNAALLEAGLRLVEAAK